MKLFCHLLALLAFARSDDGLHEARIYLVEKNVPEMRRDVDDYPDLIPLELHTETTRLTGMLLTRNTRLDQGFDIVSYDNEFPTIRAGQLRTAAFYQDAMSGAAFGVQRSEDGQREYQGSFTHKGQRYSLSVDNSVKRHAIQGLAYVARQVDTSNYDDDAISGFGLDPEVMERMEKRGNDYHVEMSLFIEFSEYDFWRQTTGSQNKALQQINYKFSYILNAMDAAYKSISGSRNGFTVTPWIKKLVVNTNSNNSPVSNWVRGIDFSVDPKRMSFKAKAILGNMEFWAPNENLVPGKDTDHTMFWCRYDLQKDNGDRGLIGQAYVGAVCQANGGFSVIEDTGFESWHTAAHELGHNLGARHDGGEYASSCSPQKNNIMTSESGFPDPAVSRTGGYEFSSCSINAMKTTLAQKSCLSNTGSNGFSKVRVSPLPGEVYDRTAQCKMIYGDSWRDLASVNTDDSCWQGLRCTQDGRSYTWSSRPADGTDCGNGKKCDRGYCH